MWNRLGIKWQLILIMTLVVTLVELTTLFSVLNIQSTQSKETAVSQVEAVTKSLNNDFLKVILNPTTDAFADISNRLEAFSNVTGIILVNDRNETVYMHGMVKNIKIHKEQVVQNLSLFTQNSLFIKKELIMDGYSYGYTLVDIDLSNHKHTQEEIAWSIIAIFPFALLLGLVVSFFLGANYTKPFTQLLNAMKKSDPTHEKITLVQTNAKNEIKELFSGYNNLMQQVLDSSKELHFQAEHDQLTSIKNRYYIEEQIKAVLKDESELTYNLLYLNLDQFKLINDSAGYQAGDELLKMIASDYANILPEASIFSRVDGDAFMVLLKDSDKKDGLDILEKSLEKLHDFRFTSENESYSVSASIGLIHFKSFEYTFKELIKAVNSALYSAKVQGRNKGYVYNPDDDITERFDTELKTATFIKEALVSGPSRFELFAQDIVPLQYETDMYSYEILIRMWDKDNNFIPPDNFLPTAQRYQQMHEIDIWVLWTYLETVTQNPEHIEMLHSAHINLAGSSLTNPDFQAKVKEAVTHFNFPWHKLELEVTETSAVGNFAKANEFILWLKNIGIGLALDDFGTGMASFEYLKSMPFDVVKIDGSFVKDMHTDPTDRAVIKYIQEIAQLNNQETVAEYVETQEDVDALREIGITYGQGYFLGKPRPLKDWL
ncbi:diguanylate cyclase/phosphodiesterase (GGDEF & EAL domains) with PAS/PAC sensor(s) [hydrothermal vent metagenome]|uniref:Diguanylate cyclase/phosphodiesterase (GGDEF & EAL domains) with PAS/PAC sensor(S) n=1 Tax=hydrothermal vent metagenome TaxID=652676 RepID=A0A1W1CJX1_9ZZZZ